MDIDAFSASRRDRWDRLDRLVGRRRLSGAEADELVGLYRGAARDLSRLRTGAPDPQLIAEMSARVAAARARVTGTREVRASDLLRYLTVDVPVALHRVRWWAVAVAVVEVAIAVVVAVWTLRNPVAMAQLGSPAELEEYATQSFEAYYSTHPPSEFAVAVWTNNARIAVLCVVGGITGLLPAWVLLANAVALGQAGAIMTDHGLLHLFLALIFPHGLLELACVFIAGGAGLRLFWTLLVPGPRPRTTALAVEGRVLVNAAVGLAGALCLAGLIEAFITPAPVPWLLKAAVGAAALAALVAYILVLGGRARRRGADGDLAEEEAGAVERTVG